MKRDMDLVRKIVLALEDHSHGFAPEPFEIEGYSEAQVGYHVLIMGESGLLVAHESTSMGDDSPNAIPSRLTWEGHEFADSVRNDTVWRKAKTQMEKIGTAALPVWLKVLMEAALDALK